MNGTVHYREGQFPPGDLDWGRLVPLIGPANAAVARYDGMLAAIFQKTLNLMGDWCSEDESSN